MTEDSLCITECLIYFKFSLVQTASGVGVRSRRMERAVSLGGKERMREVPGLVNT